MADPHLATVADPAEGAVLTEAEAIAADDVRINRQIGINALPLVPDAARIIHHCNTGGLATVAYGTALGIIRTAHEHGKQVQVFVDETRPRLQGARLTAWEFQATAFPMRNRGRCRSAHDAHSGWIYASSGAIASPPMVIPPTRSGTYHLALATTAMPFYVAAPTSTIDLLMPTGDGIEIEQRPAEEVTALDGHLITPAGTSAAQPGV